MVIPRRGGNQTNACCLLVEQTDICSPPLVPIWNAAWHETRVRMVTPPNPQLRERHRTLMYGSTLDSCPFLFYTATNGTAHLFEINTVPCNAQDEIKSLDVRTAVCTCTSPTKAVYSISVAVGSSTSPRTQPLLTCVDGGLG